MNSTEDVPSEQYQATWHFIRVEQEIRVSLWYREREQKGELRTNLPTSFHLLSLLQIRTVRLHSILRLKREPRDESLSPVTLELTLGLLPRVRLVEEGDERLDPSSASFELDQEVSKRSLDDLFQLNETGK